MGQLHQKASELLNRISWKRKMQNQLAQLTTAVQDNQQQLSKLLTDLARTQLPSIQQTLQKEQGSLNYYNTRLSCLTQNLELMRGDYTTLNELFRIPAEQPFPKSTTDYTLAGQALETLLAKYDFQSVLDIGCGGGQHTRAFLDAKKDVYVVDLFESDFIRENRERLHAYFGDFNTYEFGRQFDCVWGSHVLEHQLNPNLFLRKVHSILKEGGVLALTVPPPRGLMAGGHVSMWNPGLLLYHLVLAGFDCSEARVMRYGYNQSVILYKHTIDVSSQLVYGAGDIQTIAPYLPKDIPYIKTALGYTFDGALPWLTDEAAAKEENG